MTKVTNNKTEENSVPGTDPLAWLEEDANGKENITSTEEELINSNFDLGQVLNIRDLDALYENLGTLLKQHKEISLDASQIEKADAVSLQALAAFYQSGPACGVNINWSGHSPAFYDCAELLGLTEELGISRVE